MAKYSTGSSNSSTDLNDDDTVCELCGNSDGPLSKTNVSGTTVVACKTCKSNHGGNNKKSTKKSNNENDKGWQKYATTTEPDNDWVEKTRPNYGNAETPYLVNKYGKKLEKELYEQKVDADELSTKTEIDIDIIKSIIDSKAIRNNVTKEQISKIENVLDIQLQE